MLLSARAKMQSPPISPTEQSFTGKSVLSSGDDDSSLSVTGAHDSYNYSFLQPQYSLTEGEDRFRTALLEAAQQEDDSEHMTYLKSTSKLLMQGYRRRNGLTPLLRSTLRMLSIPGMCDLWLKELEGVLEDDRLKSQEDLKTRVAAGEDLDSLRRTGATEHELELAGAPQG